MDDHVRTAFEKAADNLTAWREQQWAAMNKEQQKEYERLEAAHRKKCKERMDEFYREKQKLVEKEKNKLMLSRPELSLRMLPGRLKERRALYVAGRNVQGRYENERKTLDAEKMAALDNFMRQAESAREMQRDKEMKARFAEAVRGLNRNRDRGRGRER